MRKSSQALPEIVTEARPKMWAVVFSFYSEEIHLHQPKPEQCDAGLAIQLAMECLIAWHFNKSNF